MYRREADRARVAIGRRVVLLMGDASRAFDPRYLARERPVALALLGLGLTLGVIVGWRKRAIRKSIGAGAVAAPGDGRESFFGSMIRFSRGALLSALLTRLWAGLTRPDEREDAGANPRLAGEHP